MAPGVRSRQWACAFGPDSFADGPPNDGLTRLSEQVRQTEHLVRQIIADSGNRIQVLDLDGRVLSVSPPASAELETGKGVALGGSWVDGWDLGFREGAQEILATARREETARFFAATRTTTGVRWWDTIVTLMKGDGAQPDHLLANSRDVTAVKLSGGGLAEKEQSLRLLVESIKEYAIFTLGLDGTVTTWNPGAERIFACTASEIVGKSGTILWTPEDRARGGPEDEMATALENGWAEDERWHLRQDGSRFFVSGTLNAIYDAHGTITGYTKSCRDVTEKQNLQLERDETLSAERAARAEVERASRLEDDFLAALSHELRTPLNAILGWTQVLRSSARSPDDIDQGLNTIERNARAQTQIIEDLLEMSRIISGKIRLDLQRFHVGNVVKAAIETVRSTAEVKGVEIRSAPGAWISAPDRQMTGNPNRLQQVFWNLLSNAIKFTPRGGSVEVELLRSDAHTVIAGRDTGEGIGSEFLPYVFDRFRQADGSTTRHHGGLGLGLAIVKQLVELYGGTIAAHSAGVGKGSTFTVSLRWVAVAPPEAPAAGSRPSPSTFGPLGKLTSSLRLDDVNAIVVDDEPEARALVSRLLGDCGAVVWTAGSAEEAFPFVEREAPNVLVSDIGMPGEDGYSLIKRVRSLGEERGGGIPAIALTAMRGPRIA